MRILADKDALSFGAAIIIAALLAVGFEKVSSNLDTLITRIKQGDLK